MGLDVQISTESQSVAARLNSSGFLRTQGLIAGKWIDAYDGKTIEVSLSLPFDANRLCMIWLGGQDLGL